MRLSGNAACMLLAGLTLSCTPCSDNRAKQPPFIMCARYYVEPDAGVRLPVTLRAGCPPNDAPLLLDVLPSTDPRLYFMSGVWVELPTATDANRCVAVDVEIPFADGSRDWVLFDYADIDRVPASNGFCVDLGNQAIAPPAYGETTIRVRVIGSTFEGEAEFRATIDR